MIRRTTGYDTGGHPRFAAILLTARCTSAALGGGLRSANPSISSTISCGNRRPPPPIRPIQTAQAIKAVRLAAANHRLAVRLGPRPDGPPPPTGPPHEGAD
jgi:hypothetical protein